MAAYNSRQIANGLAFPVVKNEPFDYYGRSRKNRFTFLTGTDDGGVLPVSGSILTLCTLPPRAKILGGLLTFGAMGTSATASIGLVSGFGTKGDGTAGVAGTGTEFLSAGAVATAGQLPFANTQALNYGYLIANPGAATLNQANIQPLLGDALILTTGGATLATGILFDGHIDFIVD